jgi:hypothetical protein
VTRLHKTQKLSGTVNQFALIIADLGKHPPGAAKVVTISGTTASKAEPIRKSS